MVLIMLRQILKPAFGIILLSSLLPASVSKANPGDHSVAVAHSRAADKTATHASKFFPYKIYTKTLPNGLHVVIIPTPEFKHMATYATAVFAGSRNETEHGKTGLAHLFEHEMFLHEYGGVAEGYSAQMRAMGTDNNAFTDYDMTFFHPTTFTENLIGPVMRPDGPHPGVIELEAARFQNLTIERKAFEVEAGAVLGEYRRTFSDPGETMIAVLSEKAFPGHPYGHTVMGYQDDVEKMPQAWDAAWEFYHNYYRPNSLAVIVVGDVDPQLLLPPIEKAYAAWKPAPKPVIPAASLPKAEVKVHIAWGAEVAPRVMVGYHTPAAKPGSKETAVGQIIRELLVSRSAPLYQKLRYQKQTVTDLSLAAEPMSTDPHWLLLDSELTLERFHRDGARYADDVQRDMISGMEDLKTFSKQPNAEKTLELVRERVHNDLLAQLDSTVDIAQTFAGYYRFGYDSQAIDKAMAAIQALTPADVDAYASRYFTRNRRVIATLWQDRAQNRQEAK
jgi:zinc protease